LIALFAAMVEAAGAAQLRTPELLPALKEAGVTDSGGQGLLYILEGALRWLRHEPLEIDLAAEVSVPSIACTGGQGYGYDVQFLLYGQHLDLAAIQAQLEMMGQSVLVAGEPELAKIHVHAADPAAVLNYGASLGLAADLLIEDMSAQVEAFLNPETISPSALSRVEAARDVEIVAFAPGKGFVDIFQSLGVDQVILGQPDVEALQAGAKAQPSLSPQNWLNLIRRLAAQRIIVLPNQPELIPLIEQVGTHVQKEVAVIPTRTAPQGIAAALAFQRQLDFETNVARMGQASLPVKTIELKPGRPNQVVGFQDNGVITVGADEHEVALELLAKARAGAADIVTIYFGQNSSQSRAELLAAKIHQHYSDLAVEVYNGGQPHSFYLISLE
jgi:dihydroxyacetone kinase-like predicted kinase